MTHEDALAAAHSVAPAFEIVKIRGDVASDLPLMVADNVGQCSFVVGPEISPCPGNLDLPGITAKVKTDGQVVQTALGAEAIDDQLRSVAWLANELAERGETLRAGQRILTGSFIAPQPVKKEQQWEATFIGVGAVAAHFISVISHRASNQAVPGGYYPDQLLGWESTHSMKSVNTSSRP